MADPTWPVAVPADLTQADYDEIIVSNVSSFQPDVGPPTSWRRSTLESVVISGGIIMDVSEWNAFITFFRTTLKDGSRPFLFTNPAYGSEDRYIFDPERPPNRAALSGEYYLVSLRLIKIA